MKKIMGKRKDYILLAGIAILLFLDMKYAEIPSVAPSGYWVLDNKVLAKKTAAVRPKVAIVKSDYSGLSQQVPTTSTLTYAHKELMVRKACELGGLQELIQPSDTLIVLKPNLIYSYSFPAGFNTDKDIVKALAILISELNPNARIVVGEGDLPPASMAPQADIGWYPDDVRKRITTGTAFGAIGYTAMVNELKGMGIKIDQLNTDIVTRSAFDPTTYNFPEASFVDIPFKHTNRACLGMPFTGNPATRSVYNIDYRKLWVNNVLLRANHVITVPVMKIHSPGVTVGIKNFIGSYPSMVYGFHRTEGYPNNNLISGGARNIVGLPYVHSNYMDENAVDMISVLKPSFSVVDAIVASEKKNGGGADAVRKNTIIAGKDVVAVDAVAATVMHINPDDVEHIYLAKLSGLGESDTGNIEIVGNTIIEGWNGIDFKTSAGTLDDNNPDTSWSATEPWDNFGSSNRIWILRSSVFSGETDINKDLLGGETTVQPVSGQNGWSRPTYFYTNRLNLDQYYNDPGTCITYAYTNVYVPSATAAELWTKSSHMMKVWLNGQEVTSNTTNSYVYYNITRSAMTRTNINLPAGYSTVLVKVNKNSSDATFIFTLAICEQQSDPAYAGVRPFGLKFLPDRDTLLYPDVKPIAVNQVTQNVHDFEFSVSPNPFSNSTVFQVAPGRDGEVKSLEIYNLSGQRVRTLTQQLNGWVYGTFKAEWDGSDDYRRPLAGGYYRAVLRTETKVFTKSILYLK